MKIPIRMIGIATSIFWIFLIVFSVSALYSMKDIKLEFGEPQTSLTSDGRVLFSFPIAIVNKGYYNLGNFNVTTEILGEENQTIAWGCTFIPVISKEEVVNTTHDTELNLTALLQSYPHILFNDTELRINTTVSMRAAEVIPIQVSSNHSMPWGAPLYNFTLGTPEFATIISPSSAARYRATIPMSFENHAFFDLTGTVQVQMYNSTNVFIGEDQVAIEARQSLFYHGSLEFHIQATSLTRNGHFEVFFVTPFFNYGPLVVPYG